MPKIGFKHSEKTKELMRISAENRDGGGMTGKHHSDVSNQKNRDSHLGKIPWNKGLKKPKAEKVSSPKPKRVVSEKSRERMHKSHIGKPSPRKGVHLSESTKEKLSISHKIPDSEKKRVKKICLGCGIEFEVTPSADNYGYGKYHSKECQIRHQVQENSPQWKGGIAPLRKVIQGQPEYIKWRTDVFSRDNYCDWFSGCKGDIEAHHIIKFSTLLRIHNIKTLENALKCEALWDVNNGITLLKTSHKAFHEMFGW